LGISERNYFDELFVRISCLLPIELAVEEVAVAYLDGKPQARGKRKFTRRERDSLFWSCHAIRECPMDSWHTETMVLALARYLGQEAVAAAGLVSRVAHAAPAALIRAVRYSGMVLNECSLRRAELEQAAVEHADVAELCQVLSIFDQAHLERFAALQKQKALLSDLSAFDLLIYASLYAFECLVPTDFDPSAISSDARPDASIAWDAINDLLAWKLESTDVSSLKLNDDNIARSVALHLRPILFADGPAGATDASAKLRAFRALVEAQIELNEFVSRSTDAFSYDDGIRFVRHANALEISEIDPEARTAWQRDGRKLERLHGYWMYRAVEDFVAHVAGDPGRLPIGRPENADANQLAWIRALQTQVRLREVYGISENVVTESGETLDLFQALLALNLMSAFFQQEFLASFARRLHETDGWISALQKLVFDGLQEGFQNRMPLTWSSRNAKVTKITAWTVTAEQVQGSPKMASAILDFWTYDMLAMAAQFQRKGLGPRPLLYERPVLKFGATLVQLPWIVGLQNNTSAAINNLRRLGARRGQARDETQRIEATLAQLFESRGFRTVLNWKPPRGDDDPGEVDVIAALGPHLLVLEVKSTFLRRSRRDAWLHATGTLRRAGRQLQRKLDAVSHAIASDAELRNALGFPEQTMPCYQRGWIVDTCIECDHQRFAGFLKVSLEEVLIALRDDRRLLNDPEGLLSSNCDMVYSISEESSRSTWTLYPDGFNVERFIDIIENEEVWDDKRAC